jgi:hypothetical protein
VTELDARIIDAASIFAGAAAVYDYARRRQDRLPHTVLWEAVGHALTNMRFWEDEHPRLRAILSGAKKHPGALLRN